LVSQNPGGFTHPAQAEAVHQAGRHLAAAGYAVDEVTPPDLDEVIETWHRIGSTDVLALLAPLMEEHGDADAQTSMPYGVSWCRRPTCGACSAPWHSAISCCGAGSPSCSAIRW
jgi:hypothetical protein